MEELDLMYKELNITNIRARAKIELDTNYFLFFTFQEIFYKKKNENVWKSGKFSQNSPERN